MGGTQSTGRLQALLKNVGLGSERMSETRTLAY